MNLQFNFDLVLKYKNKSQQSRVLTENWVLKEVYCPSCGGFVNNYSNNKPVADFYCKKCLEDFELKSKNGKFGKKVSAGAHNKIIERISSNKKPNFFFMSHIDLLSISNFFVVPKYFFVPEIIEKRKQLSETAQRAGWVGSNILFSRIPKSGQIYYIEDGKEIPKEDVLKKWHKTLFLKEIKKTEVRGWILDIMNCIDTLNKKKFALADVYAFENDLKQIHPENKNIKPKIRQQLQFLRNKGFLKFTGKGTYRLV